MPSPLMVLTFVIAQSVSSQAVASPQSRDTRAASQATGVISGIVVSADEEARPIRKARVTCTGGDVPGHTTMTDNAGRFAFAGLPPGRYTIGASKASWVSMGYGAKRPMRPGEAIPLAEGQRLDIVLRLPHGSVITGVLLDQNNEPAANALVRAMRYAMVGGQRQLAPAGGAVTDDRGVYRIFGLYAGDYIIGAQGRAGAGQSTELRLTSDADLRHAASPDRRTPPPPDRDVTMAMTYFPGSTLASQAGVVSLRQGEERSGMDFALQVVPTARIEGSVVLPGGGTPAATEVSLISLGPTAVPGAPFENFRTVRVAEDGDFQFGNVGPGQYKLLARAARPVTNPDGSGGPAQILWASTSLVIEGERVTGLSLSLEPGLSIRGQVRFEGRSLKRPADLRSIRVSAVPDEEGSVSFAPGLVSVGPDGRFSIPGVIPGRYRLNASFPGSGRTGGWQLKSILVNGQDALDASVELQPNQRVPDAAITFTDRLAQLKGTLQSPAGVLAADYSVVLFPADPSLWIARSHRIQSVRPAADGLYAFANVPSGVYLLAAVEDVEPGDWYDPAFLQRIAPAAVSVTIRDGEQRTQDLATARR